MLLVPLQIRPVLSHKMTPWKFAGNSAITLTARLYCYTDKRDRFRIYSFLSWQYLYGSPKGQSHSHGPPYSLHVIYIMRHHQSNLRGLLIKLTVQVLDQCFSNFVSSCTIVTIQNTYAYH